MGQIFCSRGRPLVILLDVLQFQGTSSRIYWTSSRNPTGRPLEFCKFASNDLELPISSRNAIKNFTGHPVEILLDVHQNLKDVQQNCSTGRPLEQKIRRIEISSLRISSRNLSEIRYSGKTESIRHSSRIVAHSFHCQQFISP